ncbi:DNA double-strand break repair protein [Nanobdella aerobiophila]|uniref:DNA double-strand break repair protein n=1 Tax=Nanobdella aerobiophila TaxID=2586965 RepID=A0A915ST38_9ARCH|nr:hypothetical protein [Nanobdella aerobiophila]BBL45861.1 DNA double-strand break repair protein [Nanobdella aerobiophila]
MDNKKIILSLSSIIGSKFIFSQGSNNIYTSVISTSSIYNAAQEAAGGIAYTLANLFPPIYITAAQEMNIYSSNPYIGAIIAASMLFLLFFTIYLVTLKIMFSRILDNFGKELSNEGIISRGPYVIAAIFSFFSIYLIGPILLTLFVEIGIIDMIFVILIIAVIAILGFKILYHGGLKDAGASIKSIGSKLKSINKIPEKFYNYNDKRTVINLGKKIDLKSLDLDIQRLIVSVLNEIIKNLEDLSKEMSKVEKQEIIKKNLSGIKPEIIKRDLSGIKQGTGKEKANIIKQIRDKSMPKRNTQEIIGQYYNRLKEYIRQLSQVKQGIEKENADNIKAMYNKLVSLGYFNTLGILKNMKNELRSYNNIINKIDEIINNIEKLKEELNKNLNINDLKSGYEKISKIKNRRDLQGQNNDKIIAKISALSEKIGELAKIKSQLENIIGQ